MWNEYNESELDKVDNTKRTVCVKLQSMSDGDMKKRMNRELEVSLKNIGTRSLGFSLITKFIGFFIHSL